MTEPVVAVDGRSLSGRRAGKGRYTWGVLAGWAKIAPEQPLLIYVAEPKPDLSFAPTSWQFIPARASLPGALALSRDARRRGAQAIFSPAAYSVTALSPLPTVMVVHDLAVFRLPEAKPALRIWLPERLLLGRALRRAAAVVAVSDFTRKELIAEFQLPREKIAVAPNAVDPSFHPLRATERTRLAAVRQKYQLPDEFLLFVGTLEPRKNISRLLAAYDRLPPTLKQRYPLILVGQIGWSIDDVLPKLKRLVATGTVHHLDYVADADLPGLYQLATALIYPSLYEGFGLPPLEAMASGCPVITSQATSLPEVVGQAARLVNPWKTAEITQAMMALLENNKLRLELTKRGLKQAQRFRWENTARVIHQLTAQAALKNRRLNDGR